LAGPARDLQHRFAHLINLLREEQPGVDPQLEKMMRKLGEAINESISSSRSIADVIEGVKASGYDVFMVLEVTVGLNRSGEQAANSSEPTAQAASDGNGPELRISRQDARFLESMKISLSPKPGQNRDRAA
jgi:hypothetical protein